MRRDYALRILLIVVGLLGVFGSTAGAQNYCPAANPNDSVPDTSALQACLDGGGLILLSAGTPGYILDDRLALRVSGTRVGAVDENNRPRLVAHANLNNMMLRADADNYDLSHLIFDGNRANRTNACTYPLGHNIIAYGTGFSIRFVDSINARCGSALEINGADFEVYNNVIAYNGFSADERNAEWADGITVHRCNGGVVRNNQIAENTDIGIVVNEGIGCSVRWNAIWNYDRYAFAGLHISAGGSGGNHAGSVFADNEVISGYDRMSFGIIAGAYPWHYVRTANIGTVEANDVEGAVIGLSVDSVDAGTVVGNDLSGAQGTRGYGPCNGQSPANYIAWSWGGASLQPGFVTRHCH